ncbi:unnamed protein product [Schistocephalus solidus]|uniref:Tudor domain-containing protein n=1 Tax=Schistocephalus solidus TaxID=70667 RepID=A0A183SW96_SCHSO|nr:unnamed protein product [Schistocephalus solidus]
MLLWPPLTGTQLSPMALRIWAPISGHTPGNRHDWRAKPGEGLWCGLHLHTRSRQLRPITLYQKIFKMNSSAKITPLDIYCNCPAERLQLCQSECQTKLQVIDAELRLCRSEKELFLAAGDEDVGERCLSFKDLAAMPHNRWARVRLPEAYWTYPMDVDLNKVVSVYSYGLKMNVPVDGAALLSSVVRSINSRINRCFIRLTDFRYLPGRSVLPCVQ